MWHLKGYGGANTVRVALYNPLNGTSNKCNASSIAGYTVANVTIDSLFCIIARFIRNVIDCVVEHVVSRVVRHVVSGVTGCFVGSVTGWLLALVGAWRLQDGLSYRPVLRRSRIAHQTEERGAIPKALGHAGGEEPPTRMTELVEDQHEEDGDGVGDQQLQYQQRGTDELVEVGLVDVPQQKQRGVLNETQHVVHSHAIPVLGLIDEVWVIEFHLHS